MQFGRARDRNDPGLLCQQPGQRDLGRRRFSLFCEFSKHIHFVRLVFVLEDVPEFARNMPDEEWVAERDIDRITEMLNDSAKAVREAVKSRVESGREMNVHYDHPILLLQHMIWHEGYHHGQIKLALKMARLPITDEIAGPLTWNVWMRKRPKSY